MPSKSLVAEGWGLLSVGTGAPVVIVPAEEREPVERLSGFELALLRAAVANTGEHAADDAPLVEVIRPYISRSHVGLGCHHAAMSLAKTMPARLPCLGCRDGRPTDPEGIEAAIADAAPEQLARYAALCALRRALGRLGGLCGVREALPAHVIAGEVQRSYVTPTRPFVGAVKPLSARAEARSCAGYAAGGSPAVMWLTMPSSANSRSTGS